MAMELIYPLVRFVPLLLYKNKVRDCISAKALDIDESDKVVVHILRIFYDRDEFWAQAQHF